MKEAARFISSEDGGFIYEVCRRSNVGNGIDLEKITTFFLDTDLGKSPEVAEVTSLGKDVGLEHRFIQLNS